MRFKVGQTLQLRHGTCDTITGTVSMISPAGFRVTYTCESRERGKRSYKQRHFYPWDKAYCFQVPGEPE